MRSAERKALIPPEGSLLSPVKCVNVDRVVIDHRRRSHFALGACGQPPRVVQVLREQDGMSPATDHAIAIGSGSTSSRVESFASDSTLK